MDAKTAKKIIAALNGLEACNEVKISSRVNLIEVRAGDETATLDGDFTADQLEALAFWMRNPGLFADKTGETPADL